MIHEVSRAGAHYKQYNQYRFQYPAKSNKGQHQVERAEDQHRKRQSQENTRNARLYDTRQMLPEYRIEGDQQVQAGNQGDPFGPQGFDLEHDARLAIDR
ncbi:hypothetical protein D3C84_932530 [compost metagenome]